MITTKKMNHTQEKLVAIFCGGSFGFGNYMLNVTMGGSYWLELLKAVATAAVCATAGLAVRELWAIGKKWLKKKGIIKTQK